MLKIKLYQFITKNFTKIKTFYMEEPDLLSQILLVLRKIFGTNAGISAMFQFD